MPSRSVRYRWPPAPCVEEEPTSLARELHGSTKKGEEPDAEGISRRGELDQYPIIISPDSPLPDLTTPPGASSIPGLGSASSDDNSSGPRTPPPQIPEQTVVRMTSSKKRESARSTASSDSSRSRSRAPQAHQQSGQAQQPARQPRPRSQSRGRDRPRNEPSYFPPITYESSVPQQSTRGRSYEEVSSAPQKPTMNRSNSVRNGTSTGHIAPSRPRPELRPASQSDSTLIRGRESSHIASPPIPPLRVRKGLDTSGPTPTLAERLEEKLRLRQELREIASDSETESPKRRTKSISPKTVHAVPVPVPVPVPALAPNPPPVEFLHRVPSHMSQEPQQRPPTTRGRASTMSAVPQPILRSASKAPGASKSFSSDEAQASSSRPRRNNSVKFQDQLPQRHILPQPAPVQKATSPQRAISPNGLFVSPCPRSIPISGQQEWYTLKGLTHLDICPSCMDQVSNSRFRDFFIKSPPKSPGQKIRCAFANAWARLAWTQMIKKQHDSLEVLYQMTRPPPGSRPCPGRVVANQAWHRVVDPETGSYLPRFHVCGSCARNVRILMPSHRDTFEPCPDIQESLCDFVTTSPRFVQYIDLLDSAASRAEPSRRPDTRDFLSYARRKCVLRDCRRDRPTKGAWHYIAALPEFSACEDCYDEVIWPLAKAHHPIARSFSASMHYLPGDTPKKCHDASCQLYSPRMRARFREAVANNDFGGLKAATLRRFEAERRFRDRREELLIAEERGYDCEGELKKAVEEWRRWE
ncbi:hypothetical protein N7478_004718 [Penicillium angulare]|uniref:uncharacterized protein n=1 Tax=Penicillium angulare TaxID=116970 RepID=UPI00254245B2|nr:uncharacterized protein N7478_004718 [Penicillium angulare]KAJ5279346.1 hypothetical protein N7478_004718 [Penicillium angulare]